MLTAHTPAAAGSPEGKAEYSLSSDVILFPVDDGSERLLDLDGDFYALSAIGAEMLKGTLADGAEATVGRIARQYSASETQVRTDLQALLGELRKKGLLHRSDGRSLSRRLRAVAATVLMVPILSCFDLIRSRERLRITPFLIFARLCFSTLGWARTVEVWQNSVHPAKTSYSASEQEEIITKVDEAVRRSAARLPSIACKERALCCWFTLRSMNIPATLVVGVQLFPMAGHCWCETGKHVLTDFPDRVETYVPVIRYEAGSEHREV